MKIFLSTRTCNASQWSAMVIFVALALMIFGTMRPSVVTTQNSKDTVEASLQSTQATSNTPARQSATASIQHLVGVMDQYHNRFIVYEDVSSAGNHFLVPAKIPNGNAPVTIFGSFTNNPHSRATAIRNQLCTGGGTEGGYYFQNGVLSGSQSIPQPNFGTVPNAGITELAGATRLTFWARGEVGGEKIDFFMGGVGYDPVTGNQTAPFPDSTRRRPALGSIFTLSTGWQQFSIDLAGANLSYLLGGFGWYATIANNPNGAVFYLDDIQYELNDAARDQRLNQPRFLRSYTTEPFQLQPAPVDDFDLRFRNTAFAYDNALALLAFLADGTDDSLRRARLIGDAFVYASTHDRLFDDGRLRNAYAAGDFALPPGWTPNGRVGTAPIPGFYTETQPACFQNSSSAFTVVGQDSIDTGNNAWAAIALTALYRRAPNAAYLAAANRLGTFIRTFRNTSGTYQGFQGGYDDPVKSQNPPRRIWASTEHNLDVFAAFTVLHRNTGDAQWQTDAQHARQFVEAMWETQRGCYLTGTTNPSTRNTTPGQLPVDVQAWSVLALFNTLNLHPQVLNCAEQNHRLTHHGFNGYDFNEDRDGVWFEGTGQMATAYKFAAQPTLREVLLQELQRAQQMPPPPATGDMKGLVAACHNGVSTGFGFSYFLRLHIGATAWNVFAQLGVNPYYLSKPAISDFDGDAKSDVAVWRPSNGFWYVLQSIAGFNAVQFGAPTDLIAPADFDGDGKTDIAVFRDGIWYWLQSSNNLFRAVQFGQAGDIPIPADYTGDGRAELAVYRSGVWYTLNLANNQFQAVQFGISSDKPVQADFDGDGRTDFAVYRDGVWYLLRSTAGFTAVQFGIASDKPTVGDYDGDGRADQAVYRNGVWYILGSMQGFSAVQFGIAGDIPVAADYDGDGKTDIAVYREGVWYLLRSQQGFSAVQFGIANDRPIPAAFVP